MRTREDKPKEYFSKLLDLPEDKIDYSEIPRTSRTDWEDAEVLFPVTADEFQAIKKFVQDLRCLRSDHRSGTNLEDDGFVLVGRVAFRAPSRLIISFERKEAENWGPALYAFRIGGRVVRLGKTESTLKQRMTETERLVSRAISGNFQIGGTNPWEAFEWRRRLIEHGSGELLARRGSKEDVRAAEPGLIRRYDPPLCNDSPSARRRPPEGRAVRDIARAEAYWQRLNSSSG
jgi:hypothetical protein